jgi:hypothetical protein
LALHLDPAFVLLHDPMHRGETKSCAFARLFGGKEGLKDSL